MCEGLMDSVEGAWGRCALRNDREDWGITLGCADEDERSARLVQLGGRFVRSSLYVGLRTVH